MNWLVLLPILLAFAARLIPGPRIVDDAYITFRYAQNLASGNGLVFNPGELVLGTTTPLYTFLLAALSHLLDLDDLPRLAWILNALLDAGSTVILFWLGRRLGQSKRISRILGLAAALAWAIAPYSVTFAVGGLETSLAIFLLLASFALYLAGRDNWAALALALGTLTRPDVLIAGLLIFGAMGLRWLSQLFSRDNQGQKPRLAGFPYQPALIFAASLLPWIIFALLSYGNPLPNSLSAKTVAYHLPPEAALVRLLQHFATPFHAHLLFGPWWVAVGLILYGTFYGIGALVALRQDRRSWPLILYPILYAMIYAAANPLIFRWYLSPPTPFWFLGILSGALGLASDAQRSRANQGDNSADPRFGPGRLVQILLVLLALASLANAWTAHPPGPPDRPAPQMAWIELEALYRQVALDLRDELSEISGYLAAGDIGTLGWYTGAPILDLVGLISPQAKAYYPLPESAYVINYAVATDYVLAELPEFIVILEVYGRNTLAQSPEFFDRYQLWRAYPTDIYGSTAMQVFRRAR